MKEYINQSMVSIIMPTFNSEKYIKESIESVLQQIYQNWELIIVDDCSCDNTIELINECVDERIVLYKNDTNSGAAVSRNKAMRKARGKYIAFLDSDDLWTKDKLMKQVMFMDDNNYVFTYTNYIIVDEKLHPMNLLMTGPKCIKKFGYYLFNWAGCLTVMYDASVIGVLQIENLKKRNDYAIWLEITDKYDCYLLNETLAQYRRREGSISNVSKIELIKSHYQLFRNGKKKNRLFSVVIVLINMCAYMYKEIRYKKHVS